MQAKVADPQQVAELLAAVVTHVNGTAQPDMFRLLSELEISFTQMKVLFVSGYSENDISDQGVIEPGLNVLQKPFTQQVLISTVQDLLRSNSRAETPVPVAV